MSTPRSLNFSAARFLPLVLLAACASAPPAPAPAPAPGPATTAPAPAPPPATVDDADFLFLEDVNGDRSLAFAREHNRVSESALSSEPRFRPLEERLRAIYGSKEKIPSPYVENGLVRNFWTDAAHPRGVWRQTSLAEYRKAEPSWTVLLDIDALNEAEGESFVYHGASCLHPAYKRCLVKLSKGGGDADVVREFDVDKKAFVPGGFVLPEGKHAIAWKDADTVYVGTDFGPGSRTSSGYARISKEWKRGTPLAEAVTVFEVKESDVSGGCWRSWDHGRTRDLCRRAIDFEHSELSLREGGKLVRLDKPGDADAGVWDEELILRLRSAWTVGGASYAAGSLLVTKLRAFLDGKRDLQVLFAPTKQTSLASWTGTKTRLFVNVLSDVKNRVTVFERPTARGAWVGKPLDAAASSVHVSPFDPHRSDDVWLWLEDFTVPSSLALLHPATGKREPMKTMPSFFDAADVEAKQHFATSRDGTKVPYFEVARTGRAAPGPTVIEAYGGFEISLAPGYRSNVGAAWIERGGTYVLANLRGGGEYGPAWHEAAMKHHRQNAYDDLAAVAEDVVRRGVATPKTLGVMGGSNGGLLTSVMLTQRPELFGAIVSKVPLTDMRRYHKLLAGASWMSEYGDPDDPDDWAALAKFSPFQNVKRGAVYPPVFFTTSTKDDRVHPGHARKMVAKLEAMGHRPLYYENIEGGHGGSADIRQRAHVDALVYTFLGTRLGLP